LELLVKLEEVGVKFLRVEFNSLNVHQMLLSLLINEKLEWENGKCRRIGDRKLEEKNHFLDDESTRGIYVLH